MASAGCTNVESSEVRKALRVAPSCQSASISRLAILASLISGSTHIPNQAPSNAVEQEIPDGKGVETLLASSPSALILANSPRVPTMM